MKTVVVSAGDHKYFSLLKGLVLSLPRGDAARVLGGDGDFDLAIIDQGLLPEDKDWLKEQGVAVMTAPPKPSASLPADYILDANWPAFLERPWLPKHFAGYDNLIWLDGDMWVQHPQAIATLIDGCQHGWFMAVPEVHPSFVQDYRRWSRARKWYTELVDLWYGRGSKVTDVGPVLRALPMINSGLIAAPTNHPGWQDWQSAVDFVLLTHQPAFGIDQVTLNYAFWNLRQDYLAMPLPQGFNWPCHAGLPWRDERRSLWVEPNLPHEPIKILHLSDQTKWERLWVDHLTADGERVRKLVRLTNPNVETHLPLRLVSSS